MCGRYSLTKELREVEQQFNAKIVGFDYMPRFNIAPSQPAAVITHQDPHAIQFFKWGLIPFWAKDPSIGNRLINARIETVTEKPSFRHTVNRKRCLVLSDGYYEWKPIDNRTKIPYRICRKDQNAFAMAGLYDSWADAEGREIHSFTILTKPALPTFAHIHDRMPAMLLEPQAKFWLDDSIDGKQAIATIDDYPEGLLNTYTISTDVNSPRNDNAELLEPVLYDEPGKQGGLFD